jgi:hypothetical protein
MPTAFPSPVRHVAFSSCLSVFISLLCNLTLHQILYGSVGLRWVWHISRLVEMRIAYNILVGTPEGKSPIGRTRIRWGASYRNRV